METFFEYKKHKIIVIIKIYLNTKIKVTILIKVTICVIISNLKKSQRKLTVDLQFVHFPLRQKSYFLDLAFLSNSVSKGALWATYFMS